MTIPHSLTKQEALRQIAELQRHIDSLPKNNHPPEIKRGMLFRQQNGDIYMVAQIGVRNSTLLNLRNGNRYDDDSIFNNAENEFEYLGHAKDLLILKPTVTDEVAQKARQYYTRVEATMKETLQAFIDGKFN